MEVITVNPRECTRWPLADRSGFEFGDLHSLAEDIKKNGQIEPILTPTVFKDLILTTDLTKVYHHGFDN